MTVPHIPDGYHSVVPYLIAADAVALLEFVERAFDAEIHHRIAAPDGTVKHADVIIGGSHVMMGQAEGQGEGQVEGQGEGEWQPVQSSLYIYVEDCDRVYATALEAGAEAIMPPADQFYGDRRGGVRDPQGNLWLLATHIEDVSHEEIERRAAQQHQR